MGSNLKSKPELDIATCPYCKMPVWYLWDNGFVSEPHNVLIADSVFHIECWDKQIEEYPV